MSIYLHFTAGQLDQSSLASDTGLELKRANGDTLAFGELAQKTSSGVLLLNSKEDRVIKMSIEEALTFVIHLIHQQESPTLVNKQMPEQFSDKDRYRITIQYQDSRYTAIFQNCASLPPERSFGGEEDISIVDLTAEHIWQAFAQEIGGETDDFITCCIGSAAFTDRIQSSKKLHALMSRLHVEKSVRQLNRIILDCQQRAGEEKTLICNEICGALQAFVNVRTKNSVVKRFVTNEITFEWIWSEYAQWLGGETDEEIRGHISFELDSPSPSDQEVKQQIAKKLSALSNALLVDRLLTTSSSAHLRGILSKCESKGQDQAYHLLSEEISNAVKPLLGKIPDRQAAISRLMIQGKSNDSILDHYCTKAHMHYVDSGAGVTSY